MESGTRLAHFEVKELIGKGGMGEVFRARDGRLDRDVALKVLPPDFDADPERLARFQREAKVLAQLQNPHIAGIFGIEEVEGRIFLVMELVGGEDLATRLKRGPIPTDEAIDIAIQVARGLEEAHERGIVHRDLKPANIKLAPDGQVKVLDFGLARAYAGETTAEGDPANSPTITAMTQRGMILGTAAYMSPEQARGKPVDRRADIWAFGLTFFEMLTGEQVFAGETISDTLAGVLMKEPDWESLPDDLPPRVGRVLRRCLERDPRQRLRDIGEARVRLQEPRGLSSDIAMEAVTAVPSAPAPRARGLLPWMLFAAALVALALVVWRSMESDDGALMHVAMTTPPGVSFVLHAAAPAAPVVSPDGRRVVFGGRNDEDGTTRLYLRSLDSGRAHALDGTENPQYPFWSPDSRWIGYFVTGEGLKKIPVHGGPPQLITASENGKGGTWNEEGVILFAPDFDTVIHRVPAAGGASTPVTSFEEGRGIDSHRHPRFLPDGRHFIYLARGTGTEAGNEIRLASLDGDSTRVLTAVSQAAEVSAGHLLFVRERILLAQPLDLDAGVLVGEATPVAENVFLLATGAAAAAFSVSDDRVLIYLAGEGETAARLVWRDRRGGTQGEVGDEAIYEDIAISPDERFAAVAMRIGAGQDLDLWIYDIERNLRTRFTFDPVDDTFPVFTPDGRALVYTTRRDEQFAIVRRELGGTGTETIIIAGDAPMAPNAISPDGRYLLYTGYSEEKNFDLMAADLTGVEGPRTLYSTPFPDGAGSFSPDGSLVTFVSGQSGDPEVYLAPFPAMAPVRQVSTDSGTWSGWRGDSQEIYYQEITGRMMAVSWDPAEGGGRLGDPELLFEHSPVTFDGRFVRSCGDGERFLAIESDLATVPRHADLVIGWPKLLEQR